MLVARMKPGDRVDIHDTSGKYIGKVELVLLKTGWHATGIDLPAEYQLKIVKSGKAVATSAVRSASEWEVPEEAWNEC